MKKVAFLVMMGVERHQPFHFYQLMIPILMRKLG